MTSSANPERLEHAKKVIKNALIGLVLVLAAATLTTILSHAYTASGGTPTDQLPSLVQVQPAETSPGLVSVIIDAIVGVLRNVIESIGEPFVRALPYFTTSTPLMGDNTSVFNLWLAIAGITDVIFVLVVILVGFHVMSFASFGFEELELRHLLPQMVLIFLLVNTSIFMIDGVIGLSNGMIHALRSGFPSISIFETLAVITHQSSNLGLAGLLIMIAFLVLTIMLLVYYVGRLITLYIGAILSPLVLLLWLIPAFKDFAVAALKTYLVTIFVLFVHVVILQLAGSLIGGTLEGNLNGQVNSLMALIVGLATLVSLLKTQGFMAELSYAASAPKAARVLSNQFIRGVSSMYKTPRSAIKGTHKGYQRAVKMNGYIKKKRGIELGKSDTKRPATRIDMATVSPPPKSSQNVVPSVPLNTGETRRAPKEEKQ